MMKLRKSIIKLFTLLTIISSTSIVCYAETDNSILIESVTVFDDSEWYPGKSKQSSLSITNNKNEGIDIEKIYINLNSCTKIITGEKLNENSKEFKEIANNTTVKLLQKGKVLAEGKLNNMLSKKGVELTTKAYIGSNEKEVFDIEIEINNDMNNQAQSIDAVFSVYFKYKDSTIDEENIGGGDANQDNNEQDNNKEDSNENDSSELDNNIDKLPQTGGLINSFSLLILGTVGIGTGMVLNKKKQ